MAFVGVIVWLASPAGLTVQYSDADRLKSSGSRRKCIHSATGFGRCS